MSEKEQDHERAKQNMREPLPMGNNVVEALFAEHWKKLEQHVDEGWKANAKVLLLNAMHDSFGLAANIPLDQAEVPMGEDVPLPERAAKLMADTFVVGSAAALAQSLKVMAAAEAKAGREGHGVIARRAERFVRVMHMQVTRFLKQPDCRLNHPAADHDLLAAHVDVSDTGQVMVGCTDIEGNGWWHIPLDELVSAGPVNDAVRAIVREMSKAQAQAVVAAAIEAGALPELVAFDPVEVFDHYMSDDQAERDPSAAPHVHRLEAHPEYVLGEDGHAEPVAEQQDKAG